MIVDPDFLDHWRTGMVVTALADPTVPMCILRIWGHCQHRRKDRFEDMPAEGLKALCKFTGDAAALETALIDGRFIRRDGADIVVLDWAEKNASLLAAWENGAKGGRPPKPKGNPAVTGTEPNANPAGTGSKPIKSKSRNTSSSLRSEETPAVAASVLTEDGVPDALAAEFLAYRDGRRKPLTARAWADHKGECLKAGWSFAAAIEKVMAKGWQGFEAKYVARDSPRPITAVTGETAWQRSQRERVAQMAPGVAAKAPGASNVIDMEFTDASPIALGR